MNQFQASSGPAVAYADTETRATFLIQTYLNLLGSICAFAAIEIYLFKSGMAAAIAAARVAVSAPGERSASSRSISASDTVGKRNTRQRERMVGSRRAGLCATSRK